MSNSCGGGRVLEVGWVVAVGMMWSVKVVVVIVGFHALGITTASCVIL